MVEPMTEDESAEMARKTRHPIEAARKAAVQQERIEEIAREYPDLTRDGIVYGIIMSDGVAYEDTRFG